MGFGKPGSILNAIIFCIATVSSLITLIVSAVYWWPTTAGYGLGVTAGVLGFLVFSLMILWMVFTNLNEFDPAWVIFLVVAIIVGVFSFIAGILYAIATVGVPAAFNFINFVICIIAIVFWFLSRGLVPVRHVSTEQSGEYHEW